MDGKGKLRLSSGKEDLGEGPSPGGCCQSCPGLPRPPSLPRAQLKPLVKVLLSHVAAIQHEDIEDVDGTDFPLGLPLEG